MKPEKNSKYYRKCSNNFATDCNVLLSVCVTVTPCDKVLRKNADFYLQQESKCFWRKLWQSNDAKFAYNNFKSDILKGEVETIVMQQAAYQMRKGV